MKPNAFCFATIYGRSNCLFVFQSSFLFIIIFYLLGFTAQRLKVCRTLGPTACSKMVTEKRCRMEKNPWLHLDSLEPAAIRFTLKCLQESARWSGCFLPANFMYLYPQEISREKHFIICTEHSALLVCSGKRIILITLLLMIIINARAVPRL